MALESAHLLRLIMQGIRCALTMNPHKHTHTHTQKKTPTISGSMASSFVTGWTNVNDLAGAVNFIPLLPNCRSGAPIIGASVPDPCIPSCTRIKEVYPTTYQVGCQMYRSNATTYTFSKFSCTQVSFRDSYQPYSILGAPPAHVLLHIVCS